MIFLTSASDSRLKLISLWFEMNTDVLAQTESLPCMYTHKYRGYPCYTHARTHMSLLFQEHDNDLCTIAKPQSQAMKNTFVLFMYISNCDVNLNDHRIIQCELYNIHDERKAELKGNYMCPPVNIVVVREIVLF